MNNEQYKAIVLKKLWFIKKHEKEIALNKLTCPESEKLIDKYGKPTRFVNHFIDECIIQHSKAPSSSQNILNLGGLLFGNVVMMGILITAAMLILGTFTLYFTKPFGEAILFQILYLVIGLILIYIGYKGIQWVNAYFTRRLLIVKRFKEMS
ncbi:hypothetical protein [Mammaliicoccus stepanovicii]|uniref:Putative staphylococcal protein n=1 Tax=Mammaliicoccus stepanovicii TaxID=643214 RepID=A0A239YWJ8_9STAP|nr:hypothetical protein [Mammaliicoccus stepanovicii]PNZ74407.1 hypothetical protein CD111_08855 [Mammaliicoccus stepanovicii]GGI40529.1 hypothetical protein GCM10010896_08830 [Mammaliicoccus stepanovicii]SNV63541.1 putative staphylococcal protein [Mammaliicoccus stepanovicii]